MSSLMGYGGDRLNQQLQDDEEERKKKALRDAALQNRPLFSGAIGNYQ